MREVVGLVVHYARDERNLLNTRRCVESLAVAGVEKVWVVDNGSPVVLEEGYSIARSGVQVVRSEDNLGYAGAINLGMKVIEESEKQGGSKGQRFIFVLNNDAIVEKGCVQRLLECEQRHEAILAPVIYDLESGKVSDLGGRMNRFTIYYRELTAIPEKLQAVDFITGAAMFAEKKVWRKIGPWDERFFMYAEDFDYCLQAEDLGIARVIVPAAKVLHSKGSSSKSNCKSVPEGLSAFSMYHIHRNRVWLAQKRHGVVKFCCFLLVYSAIVGLKLMKWCARDRKLAAALFRGYADGVWGAILISLSGSKNPTICLKFNTSKRMTS
ncbi:MAG: glycosyltransferase family 2 protein [Oligoflexia bacterium]|nr:glycosyltransferase family 2 protein [Oligoflexia bacterium]